MTRPTTPIEHGAVAHPGELLAEVIHSLEMTRRDFANHIGLTEVRVDQYINLYRRFTPAFAVLLQAAVPRYSAEHWIQAQALWDLDVYRRGHAAPKFKRLDRSNTPKLLKPSLDRCVCTDWQWEHTQKDGGCINCPCPQFARMRDLVIPQYNLKELIEEANAKAASEKDPGKAP